MAELDLNAAHRARREQTGSAPHLLTLGKAVFELPVSPPAAVLLAVGRLQKGELYALEDALAALFGERLNEALAEGFQLEDLEPIFGDLYGLSLGESPASDSSSSTNGSTSRPTSSASTRSTSQQRSSAKRR